MSNEVMKLEQVRKSCKVASVVIKVVTVFVCIAMIACLGASAVCFGLRSTIDTYLADNPEVTDHITTNIDVFGVDLEYSAAGHYGIQFAVACLVAALAIAFLIVALYMLGSVFKSILNSESPFSDEVTRTMKRSFILMTVFFLLSNGLMTAVIAGLAFWFIYTIFQYGIELQRQVDETL